MREVVDFRGACCFFLLEIVVRGRRGECVKGLTAEMMFAPRRLRRRVVVAGNFMMRVEIG